MMPNTSIPTLPLFRPSRLALALIVLCACGGPTVVPRATDADMRSLSEARAIELIEQAVNESTTQAASGWSVNVGAEQPLGVDLRLGTTNFGIEWVTPQDRDTYGAAIPQPDPSGQLRIMTGDGDDASAQVLVLDERAYRFDPDRERAERGAAGARDVEERLKRDVLDFLEYVRGQGGQ